MPHLKKELYSLCVSYVQKRMDTSIMALEAAQQASQEETKSSAGDKYETSREMMQQETNRNRAQLTESNKLMVALNRLPADGIFTTAEPGSLVITSNGKFYLSISAGSLLVDGETYFAVSPASPVGLLLKGQKVGYEFTLNGKIYKIENII